MLKRLRCGIRLYRRLHDATPYLSAPGRFVGRSLLAPAGSDPRYLRMVAPSTSHGRTQGRGGIGSLVDASRFNGGLTYEGFKASMTQNRERLEAAESAVEIDPRDLEFFRSLRPLSCVALVEDWCGDVVANLPVVGGAGA